MRTTNAWIITNTARGHTQANIYIYLCKLDRIRQVKGTHDEVPLLKHFLDRPGNLRALVVQLYANGDTGSIQKLTKRAKKTRYCCSKNILL